MKNLKNKLMFIIKESNLINLFDYEYVKEESEYLGMEKQRQENS